MVSTSPYPHLSQHLRQDIRYWGLSLLSLNTNTDICCKENISELTDTYNHQRLMKSETSLGRTSLIHQPCWTDNHIYTSIINEKHYSVTMNRYSGLGSMLSGLTRFRCISKDIAFHMQLPWEYQLEEGPGLPGKMTQLPLPPLAEWQRSHPGTLGWLCGSQRSSVLACHHRGRLSPGRCWSTSVCRYWMYSSRCSSARCPSPRWGSGECSSLRWFVLEKNNYPWHKRAGFVRRHELGFNKYHFYNPWKWFQEVFREDEVWIFWWCIVCIGWVRAYFTYIFI